MTQDPAMPQSRGNLQSVFAAWLCCALVILGIVLAPGLVNLLALAQVAAAG